MTQKILTWIFGFAIALPVACVVVVLAVEAWNEFSWARKKRKGRR